MKKDESNNSLHLTGYSYKTQTHLKNSTIL